LQRKEGAENSRLVILDSHLHAVVAAPALSAVLRDLKSFTAQQILAQVGRDWLLNPLAYYRAAHKQTAHQVWQGGASAGNHE
jgi:hypothetical protein